MGINTQTKRSVIGWMGCGAAINGLDVAKNWLMQQPSDSQQVAVHVAIDLPSVHGSYEDNIESAIYHTLMADGCAATVLGGNGCLDNQKEDTVVEIIETTSTIIPESEAMVTFRGASNGMKCTLSLELPNLVEKSVYNYAKEFLKRKDLTLEDIAYWSVHPGGPQIIRAVEKGLGIERTKTKQSRSVLKSFGNMISPTVMFVTKEVLKDVRKELDSGEKPKHVMAIGFSPGVSVDGALLSISKNANNSEKGFKQKVSLASPSRRLYHVQPQYTAGDFRRELELPEYEYYFPNCV